MFTMQKTKITKIPTYKWVIYSHFLIFLSLLSTLPPSLFFHFLRHALSLPFSLCTHDAQSFRPIPSKSKPPPISSRPHESKTPSLITNLIFNRWDRNSSRPRVFRPFYGNTASNRGSRPPPLDSHWGWAQSPIIKWCCFVGLIFQDLLIVVHDIHMICL